LAVARMFEPSSDGKKVGQSLRSAREGKRTGSSGNRGVYSLIRKTPHQTGEKNAVPGGEEKKPPGSPRRANALKRSPLHPSSESGEGGEREKRWVGRRAIARKAKLGESARQSRGGGREAQKRKADFFTNEEGSSSEWPRKTP